MSIKNSFSSRLSMYVLIVSAGLMNEDQEINVVWNSRSMIIAVLKGTEGM